MVLLVVLSLKASSNDDKGTAALHSGRARIWFRSWINALCSGAQTNAIDIVHNFSANVKRCHHCRLHHCHNPRPYSATTGGGAAQLQRRHSCRRHRSRSCSIRSRVLMHRKLRAPTKLVPRRVRHLQDLRRPMGPEQIRATGSRVNCCCPVGPGSNT